MIKYDTPAFLAYPRPENRIGREFLGSYQAKGWLAQMKRNGTATEIIVSPQRELFTFNRHNESHKLWQWTNESAAPFRDLPGGGWWVFAAELLHSKVKGGPTDTHYLHDCLVANGERLIGRTYLERYDILRSLFKVNADTPSTMGHYIITPKLWLAKNYLSKDISFSTLFARIKDPIDEGLVLKQPTAPLCLSGNNSWAIKCRRPSKHSSC